MPGAFIGRVVSLFRRSGADLRLRMESERLYRVLVETAPDAVFLFDWDYVIRFANSRAAELLGFDRAGDLIGRRLAEFASGRDLDALRSHIVRARAGEAPLEVTVLRRDRSPVPVESASCFVEDEGVRLRHVLTVWRNVSDRRLREARIQSLSEKLELIARLAQRTGSLGDWDAFSELVVDSTFVLCPGCLPSLWLTAAEGGALRCVRGVMAGRTAEADGAAHEAFATAAPVLRGGPRRTSFAVPIRGDEGSLGVLELSAADPAAFDEASREALAVFADQLGLSIQNGRLYSEVVERLGQLEALRTIDRAINSTMNIASVLGVITEEARLRLKVDAADILLFDEPSGELRFAAKAGFRSEALAHTKLSLGQGFAGRVAAERTILVVPALAGEPQAFAESPSFAGEGFVGYAGAALVAKGELQGVLEVYRRSPLEADPHWTAFFEALAGQAAIAVDNASILDELQKANVRLREAYEATIEGWAEALELRDRETEGHCRRVTEASVELAERFGIEGKELEDLRHGALLHDIGKMGIPDAVLLKPGPLDPAEFEIMKRHTTIGRNLLAGLRFLSEASVIPYSHHEHWDGSGYPRGLAGEDIPFAARLFTVIDVWDALKSDRPYRAGWPEERVLEYIGSRSGADFDPRVVDAFIRMRREIPDQPGTGSR
ncbi:MAG TPA: HD domain-containing phosphohydrolase [Rectinemataceae bacterium]|nr:HD domain-containing phosphohydrolase [Rectinemataceae bacterium]